MNLNELETKISDYKSILNIEEGKKEIILSNFNDNESKINDLKKYSDILDNVTILFQKTSEYGRNQAKTQIENIVTKCLQFVFETDIEFVIEMEQKRDIAQGEFYVISNYSENYSIKTKPEIARGGGVIDIVAIALRLAFIQIYKPLIEGPIVFDEPGKHVSSDFIFNLGEFLKQSSELFKRQIIMVTHNEYLSQICDLSYFVEIKDGKSIVKKLEK